ncbi:MAG: VWA domain-containing protein [Pseudomonadales bacterium]
MLEQLHLLRPWWLLALVPVLGIVWLWLRQRRAHHQFAGRIDPELLAVLLDAKPSTGARYTPWVAGAGAVLAILALAGPTWERLPQPVERDGDGLVLVLDLSLSMYVRDVEPSRLVRAKQKITDVLRLRSQGFTGLIAYAGDAHIVAPLTDDTETITNLLASLSPEMMPVLGSDTGAAIELAQGLLRSAGMTQGRIVLITDGIDRIADVSSLRSRDFPLSILGVGTADGAPIPLDFAKQPGRVLQTQQGDIIRARLDDARLREVAELGYGSYRTASLGDSDLAELLTTTLPGDDPAIDSERQFDQWADRGYLLALLLLPIVALTFRKGTLATIAPIFTPALVAGSLLLLAAPRAEAGWWQDLWQRPDQQAHQALIEGSPERAAALFEDRDWRAIANYRSGEYQAARDAFAAARQQGPATASDAVTPAYNHGNALARLGAYEDAIAAYDSVLAAQPEHADATFNRELVAKLLEQQQQASEQDNSEQQDNQGQQGEQSRDDQSQQNSDPNDPQQQQDAEPEEAENDQQQQDQQQQPDRDGEPEDEQQESQASRDEDSEAMEQWLRRVPDDPGGLLRRKFQYETNSRLRSGESRTTDREKIW